MALRLFHIAALMAFMTCTNVVAENKSIFNQSSEAGGTTLSQYEIRKKLKTLRTIAMRSRLEQQNRCHDRELAVSVDHSQSKITVVGYNKYLVEWLKVVNELCQKGATLTTINEALRHEIKLVEGQLKPEPVILSDKLICYEEGFCDSVSQKEWQIIPYSEYSSVDH